MSRKSSSHIASSKGGDEDEFFDAYEDLDDLLLANQESFGLPRVNEMVDKENIILTQKAEKLKGYLMQNEVMLVKLRSHISFDISIEMPEICIKLFETMVNGKFIGSSLTIRHFKSEFISYSEKSEVKHILKKYSIMVIHYT